jgi:NhaP-type Na+/H+ or K+/H+ antiporter
VIQFPSITAHPEVTVAVALAAGMLAQAAARHGRLPGIVVLLVTGLLLGPDLLGIVQPEQLGPALHGLIGFAVAVVLFEGGLKLDFKRIRAQSQVLRNLLTVGALVTAAGGALAARWLLGWGWRVSILFGALVIVTGPTVVTPLLRRIKVRHKVTTVLEAEGVLIDAVGAVTAVVALEVMLSFSGHGIAAGVLQVVGRLLFGLCAGLAAGLLLALILRVENLVPEGLQNVLTLSLVLALFQISNALVPESGVMTVTAAGMVVGNMQNRLHRDLREFKEQLTVMMIGMLFVLLAAGVSLAQVRSLGWRGLATLAVLMWVVRPLNIAVSTIGSDLTLRERGFLAWIAPRGVVAAAVASLFVQTISAEVARGDSRGVWAGGEQLQAMVFLVIGGTVLVQGLSGGLVARLLGVRRPTNRGYAILGANELGHALGRLLRDCGEEVMFLDGNPQACHAVEQDGFKVIYGNVLLERTLFRARVEDRAACIAVTPNEEANLLFAHQAIREFKVPRLYVALANGQGTGESVVGRAGARTLFGAPRDLELWALRMRRRTASIEIWRYAGRPEEVPVDAPPFDNTETRLLPLVTWRGKRVFPVNAEDGLREGDIVHFALFDEAKVEAQQWLLDHGWAPLYGDEDLLPDGYTSPEREVAPV